MTIVHPQIICCLLHQMRGQLFDEDLVSDYDAQLNTFTYYCEEKSSDLSIPTNSLEWIKTLEMMKVYQTKIDSIRYTFNLVNDVSFYRRSISSIKSRRILMPKKSLFSIDENRETYEKTSTCIIC